MVDIRYCRLDDTNVRVIDELIKYYKLVLKHYDIYELYIDGKKSYLLKQDNSFYIINSKNGVDQFSIVDDEIIYYRCDMNGLSLKAGSIYKFDDYNRMTDYISVTPYDGSSVKYRDVNATINHIHCDYNENLQYELSYYYYANFDCKDKISHSYFNEPCYVRIRSLKTEKEEKFYLTHWYDEEKYYNLALLRTVGLIDYLTTDYAGEIDVYYDRKVKDGNDVLFKNLFLSEQLHPDDMSNILLENGYDMYVSDDIINAFNKEDERYKLYKEIYEQWKKINRKENYSYRLAM